ncbi:MAG: twin-arginine translocation signal domain-containing protein, partial [Actinobacteria bacterium]|nr:twin-arginine translocation signal domain-containing protein [Actinomycetota bacterium]
MNKLIKKKSIDFTRRNFMRTTALGAAAVLTGCSRVQLNDPLVRINHLPRKFARRCGSFTANVCGLLSEHAENVKYKLNDDDWKPVRQKGPRVPPPNFTLEINAKDLNAGKNRLEISTHAPGHEPVMIGREFEYDPGPIHLPVVRDWAQGDLDVQDGYWKVVEKKGVHRVRLKRGFENYDRIVVVTGAFPQGRRVETDLIFRRNEGNPFGFGILPLWGGRPDDEGVTPSRGWDFSCA